MTFPESGQVHNLLPLLGDLRRKSRICFTIQGSVITHGFQRKKLWYTEMFKDFEGEVGRKVADDVECSLGILLQK